MGKKKNNSSLTYYLLGIVAALLLLIVISMLSFMFVNSHLWKSLSPFSSSKNIDISLNSENGAIENIKETGSVYKISLSEVEKGDLLIFNNKYDSYLYIKNNNHDREDRRSSVISSKPYEDKTNSFVLQWDGDYTVETFHLKERWRDTGVIVSIMILILAAGLIIYKKKYTRKKKKKS